MTPCKYKRSFRIPYRGCLFDSLLELKYAMSIEDDYRFLREPVIIGYDPKTLAVTNYFRESTRMYTPDFVARDKHDHGGWMIEIKPKSFLSIDVKNRFETVAHNFIRSLNLDWKFKFVCEDDISLSKEKLDRLNLFVKKRHSFKDILDLQTRVRRHTEEKQSFFGSTPMFPEDALSKKEYAAYVMHGPVLAS